MFLHFAQLPETHPSGPVQGVAPHSGTVSTDESKTNSRALQGYRHSTESIVISLADTMVSPSLCRLSDILHIVTGLPRPASLELSPAETVQYETPVLDKRISQRSFRRWPKMNLALLLLRSVSGAGPVVLKPPRIRWAGTDYERWDPKPWLD
jgi:hypothetical protein